MKSYSELPNLQQVLWGCSFLWEKQEELVKWMPTLYLNSAHCWCNSTSTSFLCSSVLVHNGGRLSHLQLQQHLYTLWLIAYKKIARAAALESFETQLFEYFKPSDVVSLQGSSGSTVDMALEPPPVNNLDDLGMEIVKCCAGLTLQLTHQWHYWRAGASQPSRPTGTLYFPILQFYGTLLP